MTYQTFCAGDRCCHSGNPKDGRQSRGEDDSGSERSHSQTAKASSKKKVSHFSMYHMGTCRRRSPNFLFIKTCCQALEAKPVKKKPEAMTEGKNKYGYFSKSTKEHLLVKNYRGWRRSQSSFDAFFKFKGKSSSFKCIFIYRVFITAEKLKLKMRNAFNKQIKKDSAQEQAKAEQRKKVRHTLSNRILHIIFLH